MTTDYQTFLGRKRVETQPSGFAIDLDAVNPMLFDWQRRIVQWAIRRGRAALFEGTGLGKTAQQIEWARLVSNHTNKPVLIFAPLAVAKQTQREGAKFGTNVTVCRSQTDVQPGVNVANYEMSAHFDASAFGGVVLD